MTEKKLSNLKLSEPKKIGYIYKCLGAAFWALKQNNYRMALQKIVMEVVLVGEKYFNKFNTSRAYIHCAY